MKNMPDGRFANTATGVLGVHRRSMLYNPLLFNTELGRSISRGYNKKFKGDSVVYGKVERKDPEAMVDVFNWTTSSPPRSAGVRGPRASGSSSSLRGKNGESSVITTTRRSSSANEAIPLKNIMEYRFQREWMERRLQNKEVVIKAPLNAYRENHTSELRQRFLASPTSDKGSVGSWKMSRFLNVQPRVQTYLPSTECNGKSSSNRLANEKK